MKVYLRDENEMRGAYIGDVEPARLMDVFETIRAVSVYDERGSVYYDDFTHQIVMESDREAIFEVVLSVED